MKIFPQYQLRLKLLGEARVYDLLAAIPSEDWFAVHSVNLPEHEYKRWGEADFVVVSPRGLILLEVKGGMVSLVDRVWQYENARGKAIRSTEGPARQALSAAIAIENLLSEQLGRKIRCRWGVVFPLCTFHKNLIELPPSRLADARTSGDRAAFAEWLTNIPFDQHGASKFALTGEEVNAIHDVLLPEFSATVSLGLAVQSLQQDTIRLTGQQFGILESLESNPRLTISGGAGTGKTELAVLCARAELAAGRHPAIVTKGKPLCLALQRRLADHGIPVTSGTLPHGTDTLVVDEGQDFARPKELAALFSELPGGLEGGRWRWFMDPNLQFMESAPDPECLARVAERSAAVTLTRNVRSTKEIVECIRTFLGADVGISQIDGYGIRVGFHDVVDSADERQRVRALIETLLEDGIRPTEIAVLGPRGLRGQTCGSVAAMLGDVLRPLTADGQFQSSSHGVACAISEFRGLESRFVMLVDLDDLPADERGKAMLYIGMSRASASLHIFVAPRVQLQLKQLLDQAP